MNKLPVISAKNFRGLLIKYGCILISSEGSHFKVEYPKSGRRATIPVHGNKDISRGFMKAILIQLGMDVDNFIEFIAQA